MTERKNTPRSQEPAQTDQPGDVLRALSSVENQRQAVIDTIANVDFSGMTPTLEQLQDEIDENGPIKQQLDVLKARSNIMIVQLHALEARLIINSRKQRAIEKVRENAVREINELRAQKDARVRELRQLQHKDDEESFARRRELNKINASNDLLVYENESIATVVEADEALEQLAPLMEEIGSTKAHCLHILEGYRVDAAPLEERLTTITTELGRLASQLAGMTQLAASPSPVTSPAEPIYFTDAHMHDDEDGEEYEFIPSHQRETFMNSVDNGERVYHSDGTPDLMGLSSGEGAIVIPIHYEAPAPVDKSVTFNRIFNRTKALRGQATHTKK